MKLNYVIRAIQPIGLVSPETMESLRKDFQAMIQRARESNLVQQMRDTYERLNQPKAIA